MDSFLIERWMAGLDPLPILDEASVSVARERVRALGAKVGLSPDDVGRLAIVMSELAMNQLVHGRRGVVAERAIERDGVPGVEIIAADEGPGIADPERALSDEPRPRGSLGAGLSSVLRLSDEVDFDVRVGQGTCIAARKLARRGARRREVAIFGRPADGERVSGDDAGFVRLADGALMVGLADGLGHGHDALDASSKAIDVLLARADQRPADLLEECDRALAGTRGAVMAAVHLDDALGELVHASAGNVEARAFGPRTSRGFAGWAFVLGARRAPRPKLREERAPIHAGEALVLFSDGLSTRARIDDEPGLLQRHPILVAARLMKDFARGNDDATVMVAA
jgi:anti-sigma regulatory factor (Ser/Thr protein kinase)